MQKNYYQPLYPGKASSETSFAVNFAALVIAFLVLVGCRFLGYTNYTYLFILFAVVITVSIAALEYLFYPKTSILRQWKVNRKINWKRVIYNEEALLVTFAVIGLFYFLFPMFTRNDFTLKYFPFLKALVPWIVLGSFPYFCLMDKIDPDPEKTGYDLLTEAARKRGFLISGGEVDLERMANTLLTEYHSGKLGRLTLEIPPKS